MPTPTKGPRLGGSPAHEKLILANLATELFRHGKIKTTETKARRLRPLAEQLITKAKRGDLHSRRRVLTVVRDKDVLYALFEQIAPRYGNRPGGYTRIIKMENRLGDNAEMALIELVDYNTVYGKEAATATKKSTRRRGGSGKGKAVEAVAVEAKAEPVVEAKAEAPAAEEAPAADEATEEKGE